MEDNKPRPDMSRGLSQVLFNYLPEKTFDLTGGIRIGKVSQIKCKAVKDIRDKNKLFKVIQKYLDQWDENLRSGFSSSIESYVFEKPKLVNYDLYPLIFRCPKCKRVYDYKDYEVIEKNNPELECLYGEECKGAKLKQIYQVAVHSCGAITGLYPLKPDACNCSDWKKHISFNERRSQKVADFRWICIKCGNEREVKYYCSNKCDIQDKAMSISPHRSGKNYYAHSIRCVDVSESNYRGSWQDDVKRYLGLGKETHIDLDSIRDLLDKMPEEIKQEFMNRCKNEMNIENINEEIGTSLHEYLETENPEAMTTCDIYQKADELEVINPSMKTILLENARFFYEMGFSDVVLIDDFPVITAVFGYTREAVKSSDKQIKINSFRFNSDEAGKIPIYVDSGKCEALLFKLNPLSVISWLEKNGFEINMDIKDERSAKYWLLQKLFPVGSFQEIKDNSVTKYIHHLIHTLSHVMMKGIAGISGFELVGLSEYLFPNALSFVVFSNRTDFSIGGMHTLFETQLDTLLNKVTSPEIKTCMYDPLCKDKDGSCHACLYLPEISCAIFNRHLSRHYVFGGNGIKGYWEGKI